MPPQKKRKYVRQLQSIQSLIEPLPTDRLIWLAKIAMDEVIERLHPPQGRSVARPEAGPSTTLHPNGRTLRG